MAGTRVPSLAFQKSGLSIQTGAGNYNLPREDVDALYGPGWPVTPVTRPEDSELPRTIDYPVGINYTLQPRVGYAGLMPVAALKAAYSNVAEVSTPVNLIIREMSGFQPMLRDRKSQVRAKDGHPYEWMTVSPDRTVPFNVWMARYKKSAKVYAAPAFYMRRNGTAIEAMEYIDGSTFFLIVNSRGNLPEPDEVDDEIVKFSQRIRYGLENNNSRILDSMPEIARQFLSKQKARIQAGKQAVTTTPAYTQIIKGIPFSFWDKNQVYFIPEPPSPAVDSPYGETFIERSWTWINIIAVMTAFELAHYRTGNTPEGLMIMPEKLFPSMAKLATGEREWNARMADGSQVQHARNRWMPEGTQYISTKSPDFPSDLYGQACDNITNALGVPASELGKKPSAGLGGKGFETGAAHDVTRQLLEGEKGALESAFNYVLRKAGVDDVDFYLDYPQEEIDPAAQQEDLWNKFSHGIFTLNDVLSAQNKESIGNPKDPQNTANMHMIITGGGSIFVVEKMQISDTGIATPNSGGAPQAGGSPFNPEDPEGLQSRDPNRPQEKKVISQVVKSIEESGGAGASTVSWSFPSVGPTRIYAGVDQVTMKKEDITDHDGAMIALFIPAPIAAELRKIADGLGLPASARMELAENMHLTLAFLPDTDMAVLNRDNIATCMQEVADNFGPLECSIQGYGVFNGSDGMRVLYASMDSVDLNALRAKLCERLEQNQIEYAKDHGFTPHITLAYFPEDYKLPRKFTVPDLDFAIGSMVLAFGNAWAYEAALSTLIPTYSKLEKHCGVCLEDAEYFGAPIVRDSALQVSSNKRHANNVEVVVMVPEGKDQQIALWKPAGGEKASLNESLGGPQYLREEAAWLLDQSLSFELVPLSYVTETPDGEVGAVVWYTAGNTKRNTPEAYAPEWIEKAAVLDYIMTQLDRGNKNYLTHPDDPSRMVLIDNGYAFPTVDTFQPRSAFIDQRWNTPLSPLVIAAVQSTLSDVSTWMDIEALIGKQATDIAKACAAEILSSGMIVKE